MKYRSGYAEVKRLRKYVNGEPTNEVKNNVPGDPDYRPKYLADSCPVNTTPNGVFTLPIEPDNILDQYVNPIKGTGEESTLAFSEYNKTIEIEGNSGNWDVTILTDLDRGHVSKESFKRKEGLYFSYIRRDKTDATKPELLSVQGIGNLVLLNNLTYTFNLVPGGISSGSWAANLEGSKIAPVTRAAFPAGALNKVCTKGLFKFFFEKLINLSFKPKKGFAFS